MAEIISKDELERIKSEISNYEGRADGDWNKIYSEIAVLVESTPERVHTILDEQIFAVAA